MAGHSSGSGYGYGFGYGYGDGYGDGDGSGYGFGYGEGYGYGYGYGEGYGYGFGYGQPLPECGHYPAAYIPAWEYLRIGCEFRALDDWIANAEEIDAEHGDGIAEQTRALALECRVSSQAAEVFDGWE